MTKFVDNPDEYFASRKGPEAPVVLTATEARQGSWGKRVLYVLVGGLILAAAAWWIAEYYGTVIAPPATDQTTTSSIARDPIANEKVINDNQPKGQPVEKAPAIQDSTKM